MAVAVNTSSSLGHQLNNLDLSIYVKGLHTLHQTALPQACKRTYKGRLRLQLTTLRDTLLCMIYSSSPMSPPCGTTLGPQAQRKGRSPGRSTRTHIGTHMHGRQWEIGSSCTMAQLAKAVRLARWRNIWIFRHRPAPKWSPLN